MSRQRGRPWFNYALGALCLGAVLAAVLVVGPASGGGQTTRRTAKAALGVVQSTVSGSGNLEPDSLLNLGFKAAGTIEHVYVKQGQHVTEGKLLASLDPVSAEVTLEQARATLQTAEASLAREEETDGETSSASAAGGSSAPSESKGRSAAATSGAAAAGGSTGGSTGSAGGSAGSTGGSTGSTGGSTGSAGGSTGSAGGSVGSAGGSAGSTGSSTGSTGGSTLSTATREANIASARAAVKSDQLTVRSDEEALAGTKLYAPQDGTIVSLSGQVGEVVSATGTTRSSSSGSTGSSGSSGAGSGSGSGSGRTGSSGGSGSGAGSSSGSGSSSAFAVLSDLSSMKLVAALSESEIHQVKVGQIATVTVEALEGRKLAAHVSEIATMATTSSGVVGYDVTFQLDQMAAGLKPGMSATAEVVVAQETGVSVPSSAISGGVVTVLRGGAEVHQSVTTGLAGDSSTIVASGVRAGETVLLPQATSAGASSLTSLLRSRLGGGGGTLGGGGAGGGVFLGGGGGGGGVFRAGGGG